MTRPSRTFPKSRLWVRNPKSWNTPIGVFLERILYVFQMSCICISSVLYMYSSVLYMCSKCLVCIPSFLYMYSKCLVCIQVSCICILKVSYIYFLIECYWPIDNCVDRWDVVMTDLPQMGSRSQVCSVREVLVVILLRIFWNSASPWSSNNKINKVLPIMRIKN